MGKVVGYVFNAEAQVLLDELVCMRNSLGVGEFFCETNKQKYKQLNRRLSELMGRQP